MTVKEALAQAAASLYEAGIEDPRLDAEILVMHVLGWSRARLYAHWDEELTPQQADALHDLVRRRARSEPTAYILGHREFYDLDLAMDPHAFIPRPETELLVERALAFAVGRGTQGLKIADVGTGSGAIAVAVAVHLPEATVYAIDASPKALEVAAENCRRHGVADRVCLLRGSLLEPLPEAVDIILANLPYVTDEEMALLPLEISGFEPQQALRGGEEGLDYVLDLLRQTPAKLRSGGAVYLEIGPAQGPAVKAQAKQAFPDAEISTERDPAGFVRVVAIETKP
ncbi:MAG: peptide chain release factor N(5)-glutamine methyltransferase [Chloroflexi bacterium]|nr:peptide chain release factor N(5)-glutamine methyltransferase [Chloroflexota bacterium]